MNQIIRPLAHNLGFDEYGQLNVCWEEHGGTCSTIIADMRDKKCAICGREWELKAEEFRKQTRLEASDEWCHSDCYDGYVTLKEGHMWHNALCYPENQEHSIPFNWKKIPNEYRGAYNTPWYKFTFLGYVPTIKVGSRKRVYFMGLYDLRQEQVDAFLELVKDEKATKGSEGSSVYIHAWDEKAAKKHLIDFITIVKMDKPRPGSRAAELEAQKAEKTEPAKMAA